LSLYYGALIVNLRKKKETIYSCQAVNPIINQIFTRKHSEDKRLAKEKKHILTHLCTVEFHLQETPQMERDQQQE